MYKDYNIKAGLLTAGSIIGFFVFLNLMQEMWFGITLMTLFFAYAVFYLVRGLYRFFAYMSYDEKDFMREHNEYLNSESYKEWCKSIENYNNENRTTKS